MREVKISSSLYVSCCYYGLKEAGLIKSNSAPKYYDFGKKISELGKDFSFNAPMAGGPIFSLVYQMPGYLNAQPHEFNKIHTGIKEYIETKKIDYFTKEWPRATKHWNLWYTDSWNNYLHNKLSPNRNRAIYIIEEFFNYISQIWESYKEIYSIKLQHYNIEDVQKMCNGLHAFNKWEKELSLKYPYDSFSIIICPETKSSASSLGPEKIVVGSKYSLNELKNSCIHEIGVRMFGLHRLEQNQATRDIFLNDYNGLIMLIENEVCCHKPYVLPEIKDDPFIKGMNLGDLYNWRIKQNVIGDWYNSFSIWYKQLKQKGML